MLRKPVENWGFTKAPVRDTMNVGKSGRVSGSLQAKRRAGEDRISNKQALPEQSRAPNVPGHGGRRNGYVQVRLPSSGRPRQYHPGSERSQMNKKTEKTKVEWTD